MNPVNICMLNINEECMRNPQDYRGCGLALGKLTCAHCNLTKYLALITRGEQLCKR